MKRQKPNGQKIRVDIWDGETKRRLAKLDHMPSLDDLPQNKWIHIVITVK